MLEKLQQMEERYEELNRFMSDARTLSRPEEYRKLAIEHADLSETVRLFRRYKKVCQEIEDSRELSESGDREMEALAREELNRLSKGKEEMEEELRSLLLPKDSMDDKNIILEIRAGTGGEEASLFAAELFRMYTKYAENKGWRTELLSQHLTGLGGTKEVIALIEGKGAYSNLKYESGIHRVQRVPVTEASGRIHTSAVTVAVLAEAEEVDVDIKPEELRIDVFRSTGPGGQSVNTTDSAVRVTHLPTGLVVTCQDEKSQHKNKAKALKVLRARLLDRLRQEQQEQRARERKQQIGSGDRSGRIRTYNFPQNRVTDHRINLTLYRLESVLEGQLDEFIQALYKEEKDNAIKDMASSEPVKI